MISVAFYKGTPKSWRLALVAKGIRLIDRGIYSHCEMVFSDGVSASSSLMDGGVRFKKIDFIPEHWDFINVPQEKCSEALQWFRDHEGAGYDVMGILAL